MNVNMSHRFGVVCCANDLPFINYIYIGRDCKETSLVGGSRLLLLLLVLLERFDTFGHDA